MKDISLKELLEAGCHFGHQVPRWNPRASSFIYTQRDGIHIIDLAKTKQGLEQAADFVKTLASQGGKIIFVGTKRQARSIIEEEGRRCGAFFLVTRWLGGLLTNWEQIKKNLAKLRKMREEKEKNLWEKFTKKEQLEKARELAKLEQLYGGIADLEEFPQALFLIDLRKEDSAVREALKTEVKIVGIVDTNANPDDIDYPIPANDDAVGSIKLITSYIADAYLEGRQEYEKKEKSASVEVSQEEPAEKKRKKIEKKVEKEKSPKNSVKKKKAKS